MNRRFNNSYRGAQNRGVRPPRRIKRLDPSLFLNRGTGREDSESYLSETLFSDFNLDGKLKRNIAEHGYTHATLIQEKAIPPLLEGKDVIGIANTGTGKTAAFLIPLVNKILANRNERVIILVPTRELAMQIEAELRIFKKGMDFDSVLCIGGTSMGRQVQELRHSPHFVIGTPGRIKDLVQNHKLNLQMFQNIVLDEVDRMVDIGFIKDIKYFISMLPKKRQSLFFSATVSGAAAEILKDFVVNPVTVTVKNNDNVANIDQDIIRIRGNDKKIDVLHSLLRKEGFDKVLIFGRTKWGIEKLTRILIDRGFRASAIHGNRSLEQRKRALAQFKQNQIQVLLATDVASRGLDIDDVTHVINYDAPETKDDYIHRIGRTGRAGKRGIALTFVE